jgi:dipeptidyl aminopeptidase/acylaminoacyl peptidase
MSHPLSPDTLVYGLSTASNPQVSPDGSQIVYTLTTTDPATKKSTSHLWLCTVDGSAARQITRGGERNSGACWSPDGRQIAFVSDRVSKGGIFVLPAASLGEAREVTRHNQPVGDLAWSPDGTQLAYTVLVDPENPDEAEPPANAAPPVRVTRRFDYKQDNRGYLGDARLQVMVVPVAGGERRQVTRMLNDHGFPQWSPDGRSLAVKVSHLNGLCGQLALIEVATGEVRLIGPESGSIGIWAWSPSSDRLIFAGDTQPTALSQVDFFIYDIGSRSVRRLTEDLQSLPESGFPTIQPPAQPVWLDERRALYHAVRAGASVLEIIDSVSGQVERVQAWSAVHACLSVDAARQNVVQAYGSLETTGELVVFDLASGETRAISALNAAVWQDTPPAAWEKLTVERGDFSIDAWLLLPPNFDPGKRYPLVLDVHGGPHGFYGYAFNAVQQCLATNDVLVVFANPRGSGSYGRHFTQQVIRDWGGEDYLDLQAVVDAVAERPYVDANRLGIWGYSYGGYMTSWTIGQTNRFKAAVCGAPCFDLESMYGTSDIGHIFGDLEWGTEPYKDQQWYADHSPSTYAHRATTPTLIIHGEADDRCPIGQGEQMFVALKKAGCEVEFARYPGGSHLFLRVGPPEHRADVLARILSWFKTHLGEPA